MPKYNQKRKKYFLNDYYFKSKSLQSCYFAGLLAADGCVYNKGNSIGISLKSEDKYILELLSKELASNLPVKNRIEKGKFLSCKLEINSFQIKEDLMKLYSLTERKSLTLKPPILTNTKEIDSFICGYIDGDGSILRYKNKYPNRNDVFIISILGTKEMLYWIQNRFESVVGFKCGGINRKRKNSKNTYVLSLSSTAAREVFKHYYTIPVVKLYRKWDSSFYDYCNTFTNRRYTELQVKIKEYIELSKTMNYKEIALAWNKSPKTVNQFYNKNVKHVLQISQNLPFRLVSWITK